MSEEARLPRELNRSERLYIRFAFSGIKVALCVLLGIPYGLLVMAGNFHPWALGVVTAGILLLPVALTVRRRPR